jgi:hypothetical protein
MGLVDDEFKQCAIAITVIPTAQAMYCKAAGERLNRIFEQVF